MRRTSIPLIVVVVLLALSFWAIVLLPLLMRALEAIGVRAPVVYGLLAAPHFGATLLLADLPRYVIISVAALVASIAAGGALIARHCSQVWRRPAFYLCLAGLAGVLTLPFATGPYEPAVRAADGAELRQVERPDKVAGVVRKLQAGAEVRPLVYEPLGWTGEQMLVYRTWRGAGCDRTGDWQDGESGPVLAYDVAAGASQPWDGALAGLYREPCPNGACVRQVLVKCHQPADRLYFAGRHEDVLPSPDGK